MLSVFGMGVEEPRIEKGIIQQGDMSVSISSITSTIGPRKTHNIYLSLWFGAGFMAFIALILGPTLAGTVSEIHLIMAIVLAICAYVARSNVTYVILVACGGMYEFRSKDYNTLASIKENIDSMIKSRD